MKIRDIASLAWLRPARRAPIRRGDAPRAGYDVVVVGGGVRAAAIARGCALGGASVALFAPGEIAGAPDERAWPVIRGAHRDPLRIASDARAPESAWSKIGRARPGARERTGCLTLSLSPYEVEALAAAAEAANRQGVSAWMVPAQEVAALAPPLSRGAGLAPALYEPGAVTVDADALAFAMAGAAASAGAELFDRAPVASLEREGARVTGVRVREAPVSAAATVLADDFAAIRLVRENKGRLSLKREERVMLRTEPGAPALGAAIMAGDVTLARDWTGAVVVSGPLGADAAAEEAVRLAPGLAALAILAQERLTAWEGVDGRAQVGAAEIPGLWLALGFGRDALSGALPAARHLALSLGGRRPEPGFEPFAPTRRPAVREAAR